MLISLDDLRRFTVARNFFQPTTLKRAIHKMRFVQADPIRAPARAQDLILRHRVKNYRAGDLERRYATLDIEEDVFIAYGFVIRSLRALMHPRDGGNKGAGEKEKGKQRREDLLLEFVRERGAVHPREVDEHFAHGTVKNYWGGSSNATTHMLEDMHYRGLLRVARREKGVRIYAVHELPPKARENVDASVVSLGAGKDACAPLPGRLDALVDVIVDLYAPLPGPSLSFLVRQLSYAAPQWQGELTSALQRAKERLARTRVDGVDWYWAVDEDAMAYGGAATECCPSKSDEAAMGHGMLDTARLLAPFDPVVRDRARFEMLWGWVYRFEAYTPVAKRKLGYYALPLLWRDRVIGWANLSVENCVLKSDLGYVSSGRPRDRAFKHALEAELNRVRTFLRLER